MCKFVFITLSFNNVLNGPRWLPIMAANYAHTHCPTDINTDVAVYLSKICIKFRAYDISYTSKNVVVRTNPSPRTSGATSYNKISHSAICNTCNTIRQINMQWQMHICPQSSIPTFQRIIFMPIRILEICVWFICDHHNINSFIVDMSQ